MFDCLKWTYNANCFSQFQTNSQLKAQTNSDVYNEQMPPSPSGLIFSLKMFDQLGLEVILGHFRIYFGLSWLQA